MVAGEGQERDRGMKRTGVDLGREWRKETPAEEPANHEVFLCAKFHHTSLFPQQRLQSYPKKQGKEQLVLVMANTMEFLAA